ncbi:hypothetical protein GPECTOR_5g132 [Gonium pectorale]|uniref:ABM domain-containing protein n=1 Tax=Gonium pectorale TaxID=33097 RepID=A0A150GWE2_GONPE|nr:hypothetical protein GPECTOR_5g132 [Gonium pectorale]|eukprot:KXZ54022.1 hypothetical protein GPECTOR_5g132 [Gonium pectorale]
MGDGSKVRLYSEWETYDDLNGHLQSRAVESLLAFLEEQDVRLEADLLRAAGDLEQEYRAGRVHGRSGRSTAAAFASSAVSAAGVPARDLDGRGRHSRRDGCGSDSGCGGGGHARQARDDPRRLPAYSLVTFSVPPSQRAKFEEAFTYVQARVARDEEANRFYVLRRFATLNHRYVLRGGWDSLDAYFDHVTSKRYHDLLDFAADRRIEWGSEPFRVLASSEDEEVAAAVKP